MGCWTTGCTGCCNHGLLNDGLLDHGLLNDRLLDHGLLDDGLRRRDLLGRDLLRFTSGGVALFVSQQALRLGLEDPQRPAETARCVRQAARSEEHDRNQQDDPDALAIEQATHGTASLVERSSDSTRRSRGAP